MKDLLKTGYCRLRQLRINRRERNYVYKVMRTNGIPDKPCAEEAAWLRKWRPLYASVSPVYLRCFRAYLTENRERIVPSEISASLIEPLLNPARYRFYYEDKNVYDRLFGPEAMPRTYLRRMEGQFYDASYRPCDFPAPERLRELTQNAERIIVKPTVDTESGRDIVLYRLDSADGTYKDQKGEPLTPEKTGGTAGGGKCDHPGVPVATPFHGAVQPLVGQLFPHDRLSFAARRKDRGAALHTESRRARLLRGQCPCRRPRDRRLPRRAA